jgi:hypothetical protein
MADLNSLIQNYQNQLQNIQGNPAYKVMTPELVNKTFASGGSFANTLGYSSPSDLAGLTPAQFDDMMNTRAQLMSENLKQVQGMASLRDQIYGISEGRQAARQVARDAFEAGNTRNNLEFSQAEEDQRLNKQLLQNDQHFQKDFGLKQEEFGWKKKVDTAEIGLKQAGLGIQQQDLALRRQHQSWEERYGLASLAQNAQQHRESLQFQDKWHQQSLGLEQQKVLIDSQLKNLQIQESHANNQARREEIRLQRENLQTQRDAVNEQHRDAGLAAMHEKLGTLELNAAKAHAAKPDDMVIKRDYFNIAMQKAALESPVGMIYNTNKYDAVAGGYSQLMLGPDHNWYGIQRDKNGKIVGASKQPIVVHPAPQYIKK